MTQGAIVHEDGRTDAERAYDALKDGSAYVKPAANQDDMLTSLLEDMYGNENAVAGWIDRQRPAMLDVATARLQALGQWEGEITTHANGNTLRFPPLENAVIGELEDGTDVYGDFDNDDKPMVVVVEWEGFSICAGHVGFDLIDEEGDKEYEHITLAQWESLKNLVNSGVIDQALYFATAWHAQGEEEEDTDTIIAILEAIDGGE